MPQASSAISVASLLKLETEKSHVESESLISPKLVSIKDPRDYAQILLTFYGFFHPLEQRVARIINPSILPDIASRRNASLILSDLSAMNFPTHEIPLATNLPEIETVPAALGALYVMEGSTLGGRMIMKMLMKNPALPIPESQLHFFAGYGADTGNKWITFQNLLNTATEANEVIKTANLVFDSFSEWIKQTLYNESEN